MMSPEDEPEEDADVADWPSSALSKEELSKQVFLFTVEYPTEPPTKASHHDPSVLIEPILGYNSLAESVDKSLSSELDKSYSPVLMVKGHDIPETLLELHKSGEFLEEPGRESPIPRDVLEEKDLVIQQEPLDSLDCPEHRHKVDDGVYQSESLCSVGWDSDSSCEESVVRRYIFDKPVPCRAKASLPGSHLYFQTIRQLDGSDIEGVFAKKPIPKRTQFGPIEGVVVSRDAPVPQQLELLFDNEDGEFTRLDVSNENFSNWMRYVRPAENLEEQNLVLSQLWGRLYFTTTRAVAPDEELKVWYSISYAHSRGLALLHNTPALPEPKEVCLSECVSPKEKGRARRGRKGREDRWSCSHCQRSFPTPTMLNFHMLTHAADNLETRDKGDPSPESMDVLRPVPCSVCEKKFISASAANSHMKTHAEGNKFECPICKETFSRVLNLKVHIHSHAIDGVYWCNQCPKSFREYKHIRNHIRAFHSGRKHPCITCDKRFPTPDKLRIHQLTHSDERQFLCAFCGKQFKRKDKLCEHMRKLHGPGARNPGVVKARKSEEDTPRAPAKTSTEDYNLYVYKCHICVIGFKRRGMLVNHLANRHPDVPVDSVPELQLPILKPAVDFFCQYCDKIYKSSSKRKQHILKVHPGKSLPATNRSVRTTTTTSGSDPSPPPRDTFSQPAGSVSLHPHACPSCHRQYATKAKLLQHQRKHHGLPPPKTPQPTTTTTTTTTTTSSHLLTGHEPQTELDPKHSLQAETSHKFITGVADSALLLPDQLTSNISEFEVADSDQQLIEGEFIIDASTLKRFVKFQGEVGQELVVDGLSVEMSQLISESRPDRYFKVVQTPGGGLSLAQPVEVWDPLPALATPAQISDPSPPDPQPPTPTPSFLPSDHPPT